MTITWSLANGCGQQQIDDDKKYMSNAGDIEHHADVGERFGAPCPMEHIQGFTRSHWMPPSGECLCRITLAAAMVDGFVA
jgi:hypothetical protein